MQLNRIACTSDNPAYTERDNLLALRDIAPFGRNVVYAGIYENRLVKQQFLGLNMFDH